MNMRPTFLPRTPLMSPDQFRKMVAADRFRSWRDKMGGQWSQDIFSYGISVASLAPNASVVQQIQIQADSAFEWLYTTCGDITSGSQGFLEPVTLQVTDGGSSRSLFDRPLPLANIAGYGQYPHILPVPRRFLPRSTVSLTLNNYDSAITFTNLQVELVGRKIIPENDRALELASTIPWQFNAWTSPDNGRMYVEDYYAYSFSLGNVASNANLASGQDTIIQGDSDFEWINTTMSMYRNATTGNLQTPALGLNFILKDFNTGRFLFNQQQLSGAMAGSGALPFVLPVPRIFKAKSQLHVDGQNLDSVTYNSIYLVLEGRKIFELS